MAQTPIEDLLHRSKTAARASDKAYRDAVETGGNPCLCSACSEAYSASRCAYVALACALSPEVGYDYSSPSPQGYARAHAVCFPDDR
jgi:tryptophanase